MRRALARRKQLMTGKWLREDIDGTAQLDDFLVSLLQFRRFQEFPFAAR